MATPGTTAPFGSATRPSMLPVVDCDCEKMECRKRGGSLPIANRNFCIFCSLQFRDWITINLAPCSEILTRMKVGMGNDNSACHEWARRNGGFSFDPIFAVGVDFLFPDRNGPFSSLISHSQASKAALRWGAATEITTLVSPISRRPVRWTIPTLAISNCLSRLVDELF